MPRLPDPVPGSSSDTGVGEKKVRKTLTISSHFIVSCSRFLNSAHPAPFNCAASRRAQFVESVDFFKGGVLRSGEGVGVGWGRGVIPGFWGWKFWQVFFWGEGVA